MMNPGTISECLRHNDWARDKLMDLAAPLSDAQLDRPFEMGAGSLRATLRHHYGAERAWAERVQTPGAAELPRANTLTAPADIARAGRHLAESRRDWLATLTRADLDRNISYTGMDGQPHANTLSDILLHVGNHGAHHRAQALNMLRHSGVKPPGLDYLFMRIERPTLERTPHERQQLRAMGFEVGQTASPPAALDLATIRRWYGYSDWATRQLLAAAAGLDDAQLDREFELGLGRLRKTLLHLRDAEQWWCDNWTCDPAPPFEPLPETTPIAELATLMHAVGERRDAYLARLADDDLQREVAAEVRTGVRLRFRLGESLLQLPAHGTHHRAQALNMLRHVGAAVPALDYITMCQARSTTCSAGR